MSNIFFSFKQFTIYHDKCAMKVGTDGVLLGAWASVPETGHILDIGTGTGLIALMCAQRSQSARIDAVEIDPVAASQAEENCSKSIWSSRIKVINNSFQNFINGAENKYDLIISNPPFFRSSLKPIKTSRAMARHDDQFTLESLFHHTVPSLKPGGKIALIYPSDGAELAASAAFLCGLYPVRKTFVSPSDGKKPNRCLMEFSSDVNGECKVSQLNIRTAGREYSDPYKELTRAFYLKF